MSEIIRQLIWVVVVLLLVYFLCFVATFSHIFSVALSGAIGLGMLCDLWEKFKEPRDN